MSESTPSKISAIVIALNEENNIQDCLAHLAWADEILLVDGGSVDQTKEFALAAGAHFLSRPFTNFAEQRNFALSSAAHPWVLFVDADERISAELAEEVRTVVRGKPCAYAIPRHNYFFGKRLRFSGSKEDAPIRFFPKNSGAWVQPVHEYFQTTLPVENLENPLIHHTTQDLAHYLKKVECYVPLEVETMRQKGRQIKCWDLWLRPAVKFLYLYVWKRGVLDGWVGVQFAALSSYYDFKKYQLFYRLTRQP